MRVHEQIHISHDEVLPCWQVAVHQLAHHSHHGGRMEDPLAECEQQHNEWEKRQDDVCGDREGIGVHAGLRQVSQQCNQLRTGTTFNGRGPPLTFARRGCHVDESGLRSFPGVTVDPFWLRN